jgi:hypothetical protein
MSFKTQEVEKMKKFVVTLFVFVGIFLASTVFASEWYTVQVTGGKVDANQAGGVVLPAIIPAGPVVNLDSGYAPGTTVAVIDQLASATLPTALTPDGWNAAGWWEFAVTGSSGSGWNDVFGGGNYTFTSDWNGLFNVHFGELNTTFDAIYGKWSRNNDSVWTYFGLYTPPNTAGASTPGIPPIGVFAFVADDPLLYPPPGFPSLQALYDYPGETPITIASGTGIFEATSVPEPATMLLLGLGLMGVAGIRRKFKG